MRKFASTAPPLSAGSLASPPTDRSRRLSSTPKLAGAMTTDSAPSSLRIVLNVGGVRFETTRQTIEKSLMLIGLVDTVRAGFSASSPPA